MRYEQGGALSQVVGMTNAAGSTEMSDGPFALTIFPLRCAAPCFGVCRHILQGCHDQCFCGGNCLVPLPASAGCTHSATSLAETSDGVTAATR